MRILSIVLAGVIAVLGIHATKAETYPSRPITIIVPFPAGGPTDTVARIVAEKMREPLGQTLIIENVTGAGSTIGTTRAVNANPDGYTLIVGNWSSHVGAGALYPVSWHIVNDLQPVIRLSTSALMIVAKKDLPANNAKELIALMKSKPGMVTSASVGSGSGAHICGLYFMDKTGTQFQFVPYRGGAPAMQDLIAGHVDTFCGEASQTLSSVRAGQVKALVVMADERWEPLPDVPTMKEVGLDLTIPFWHGLWAPKGTPADIVEKLNAAALVALKDPTVQKRISDLGQTIPAAAQLTPAALGVWHKAEIDKWWPVIKAANIKVN